MKSLLFLLLLIPNVYASRGQGMELTLSCPYPETAIPGRFIWGMSWFNARLSPFPGYAEYGLTLMPPWGGEGSEVFSTDRTDNFFGLYGGHVFVPFHGLIRPGFQVGWISKEVRKGNAGTSRREFAFYGGVKVQVSCFTLLLSNQGLGGGVNFKL